MISYFIINKAGTVLYESIHSKKYNVRSTDSNRIRYLPLLVIKDLIKANLNDSIQYVRSGKKTIVFKEVK
jgi:hypothetical protein